MSMLARVVEWVSPISEPNQRGHSYVTVVFSNEESAYIGKASLEEIERLHALLTAAVDKDAFYMLEDTGKLNKKDKKKYKLVAFDGYNPPQWQAEPKQAISGVGVASSAAGAAQAHPAPAPTNTEASIRAAVALKAAAGACTTGRLEDVLAIAEQMDAWLAEKSGAGGSGVIAPPGDAAAPAPDTSSPESNPLGDRGGNDGRSSSATEGRAGGATSGESGEGEGPGSSGTKYADKPVPADWDSEPRQIGGGE